MAIKFLSFDIDDTLLPVSNHHFSFVRQWKKITFDEPPLLCYNTGRLIDDTMKLILSRRLPVPSYIICGVGTAIWDVKTRKLIKAFSQVLEEGWNIDTVNDVMNGLKNGLKKQADHFQNEYKSSWYLHDATPEMLSGIEQALAKKGLGVNVVYSSDIHLDILPKWANKGNALKWLLDFLNIPADETIVAGDSGNDMAMFQIEGIKGIVVANAHQELLSQIKPGRVYFSGKEHDEGVVDGLLHFGARVSNDQVLENTQGNDEINLEQINLMDIGEIKSITDAQYDLILQGYEEALKVILKNITPMGFSACSLNDNAASGTDVNYRSVWARDGSIAITGTVYLIDDTEVYNCQLNTLKTLLKYVSPAGQIPSNVSLDTGKPDYSGVGGICSIDSGLWLIIAFHDFIKASGNITFLRENIDTLQRIMIWLTAQDGNNDALLEIPEAGDWTDLFGRSYNVLYDEVIWYQANVCFGRLLELLGEYKKAGNYLRWSHIIKREIIQNFWPTTGGILDHSTGFAEKQFTIGDARYLIAQVTPFDFSWRCDVYANILAFLYNVVDKEKATTTFRFIWGAGVNDPFPVKNVYPAVMAGDPDWRPYYTVNLLNLPNHYHNGGIWPFVGAGWVRYIDKLGMRELALKELYKLAELNKLGIFNEWEFNEWANGTTGRPMGKSYQAWSASEYIHTCHELNLIN
ncbi:HAD-IIB family hydrolase [Parafilimonas sp.]|uniref:HAD-IIB family hydrolase n=1 Tax=Parafilimonas sp. TaxID=1969739 RepID=UPI0039E6E6CA